jgi:hypothetical protein
MHAAVIFVVFAAWIAFWVGALASIFRQPSVPSFERGVWTVVVIVLPFLGPLVWFGWGRTRRRTPVSEV